MDTRYYTKRNTVVRKSDMPLEKQTEMMELAHKAMARYYLEADMARYIREYLMKNDKEEGEWHVAVGRNFGSSVRHEAGTYIYFYIAHFGFLMFKSGDIC